MNINETKQESTIVFKGYNEAWLRHNDNEDPNKPYIRDDGTDTNPEDPGIVEEDDIMEDDQFPIMDDREADLE